MQGKNSILKSIIIIITIILLICIMVFLFAMHEYVNSSFNEAMIKVAENIVKDDTKKEESIDVKAKVEETELDETQMLKEEVKPAERVYVATRSKVDRFYFAGDNYFSRYMKGSYDKGGISSIISPEYLYLLKHSDFNMGNLECAITDDTKDEADKKFTFATPTKYAKVFKEVGFNLFTLANNHILDYGEKAYNDTAAELDKNGIYHIGVGKNLEEAMKPFIFEIEGKTYAIFTASEVLPQDSWKATSERFGVANGYDISAVCENIKKYIGKVDKIIVYMHWGKELDELSSDLQKQHGHKLVDAGADLVVGSHSHTIQEIEYYKNVPIVYSLGNFIYGATKRETILLEVDFDYNLTAKGFLRLKVYPGVSNYEQVTMYWQKANIASKCMDIQKKCLSCYIAPDGVIVTKEQWEEVLNSLATKSEIKELE